MDTVRRETDFIVRCTPAFKAAIDRDDTGFGEMLTVLANTNGALLRTAADIYTRYTDVKFDHRGIRDLLARHPISTAVMPWTRHDDSTACYCPAQMKVLLETDDLPASITLVRGKLPKLCGPCKARASRGATPEEKRMLAFDAWLRVEQQFNDDARRAGYEPATSRHLRTARKNCRLHRDTTKTLAGLLVGVKLKYKGHNRWAKTSDLGDLIGSILLHEGKSFAEIMRYAVEYIEPDPGGVFEPRVSPSFAMPRVARKT